MPRSLPPPPGLFMSTPAEYTAICCACHRSIPVPPANMGKRRACPSCGFVVLMPRLDEFEEAPVRETYQTVLKKVATRIEEGLLPGEEDCQGCGTPTDRQVNVWVECESSREETVGGTGPWAILSLLFGLLLLPFLPFIIFFRHQPGVSVIRGRDTNIRIPVCLCEPCQRRMTAPRFWPALLVAVLGLALAVVVGLLAGWWWVVVVLVTLSAAGLLLQTTRRRWVEEGRDLLRAVPDYEELLQTYRSAEVLVRGAK